MNISKSTNDSVTKMEKLSFLLVVLSVVIAETETALYLVYINPFLFLKWNIWFEKMSAGKMSVWGIEIRRTFCWARKYAAQKLKFSIKDFFSKCDQIPSFLWIRSHLLKKYLILRKSWKLHYLWSDICCGNAHGRNFRQGTVPEP